MGVKIGAECGAVFENALNLVFVLHVEKVQHQFDAGQNLMCYLIY